MVKRKEKATGFREGSRKSRDTRSADNMELISTSICVKYTFDATIRNRPVKYLNWSLINVER